jgi:hypothetical protein
MVSREGVPFLFGMATGPTVHGSPVRLILLPRVGKHRTIIGRSADTAVHMMATLSSTRDQITPLVESQKISLLYLRA